MTIATINPATGETVKTFDAHTDAEVEERLALADETFGTWRQTSFAERAELVSRLADVLEGDTDDLARTMIIEMGKPLEQAKGEVRKCAGGFRYFAEHAEALLHDTEVPGTAAKRRSYVTYQPLGTVLAVMPWNFPLWQVGRFAARPSCSATPAS